MSEQEVKQTGEHCAGGCAPSGSVTEVYGKIVVIKRTGQDSASFELIDDSYTFGR
jgi:hypothetical protein